MDTQSQPENAQSQPQWERLGRLLAERRARIDPRYKFRKTFAEDVGLNLGLLRDLENATRDNFTPPTLAAVEIAYRWARGSVESVLDGGDPVELNSIMAMAGTATARAEAFDATVDITAINAAPRTVPRWLAAELERRGADPASVVASVEVLREAAAKSGYTLAELLVEAGLVDAREVELRDPLDDFRRKTEEILADPRLSRGQRKDVARYAKRKLAELEGKGAGPHKP